MARRDQHLAGLATAQERGQLVGLALERGQLGLELGLAGPHLAEQGVLLRHLGRRLVAHGVLGPALVLELALLVGHHVALVESLAPCLVERVPQLGDLVAQVTETIDGVGLLPQDGVDVAGGRRQLAHGVHVQRQVGVARRKVLARVGGDGLTGQLVPGRGQAGAGGVEPDLGRLLAPFEVVETGLGDVQGPLHRRHARLDGGDLAVEVVQAGVGGVELVEEVRLLGRDLGELALQRLDLAVDRRLGGLGGLLGRVGAGSEHPAQEQPGQEGPPNHILHMSHTSNRVFHREAAAEGIDDAGGALERAGYTSKKRLTAMAEPAAPTTMPMTTRKIPVPRTSLLDT